MTSRRSSERLMYVNPIVSNTPFLYLLKTSENPTVFWCFQGAEKGCIENKWVKLIFLSEDKNYIKHLTRNPEFEKPLSGFWPISPNFGMNDPHYHLKKRKKVSRALLKLFLIFLKKLWKVEENSSWYLRVVIA